MISTQEVPYRKYTFWVSSVVILCGIFGFFLRSFITEHNLPLKNSIVHNQQDIAIMKEDIKDLEKNYEHYARANLEALNNIQSILLEIHQEKK